MNDVKELIRWGSIGGGAVVETKSGPAFNKVPHSQLYALTRRDISQAIQTAERVGATKAYSSVSALINDPLVDAVYIATPPGLHYEHAMLCCAAGKPAYVEKPFARNYPEALKIVEAFEQANVPLFVAHYRRALPHFIQLKKLLSEGIIGVPCEVDLRLTRNYTPPSGSGMGTWLYNPTLSGGGKFFDIAPHTIDLLVYLFGDFVRLQGIALNKNPAHALEDLVVFTFMTSEEVVGTANFNLFSHQKEDAVTISGTEGSIALSIHGTTPIVIEGKKGRKEIPVTLPEFIQEPMIESVVKDLCGRESCSSTGREALKTVRIVDEILSEYYQGREDFFWERMER